MENYLDLINDYFKKKNDSICFNSFSNDVRLFQNHIIKTFNSRKRLESCIVGLQIMSNTPINVPSIQFICPERNISRQIFIQYHSKTCNAAVYYAERNGNVGIGECHKDIAQNDF